MVVWFEIDEDWLRMEVCGLDRELRQVGNPWCLAPILCMTLLPTSRAFEGWFGRSPIQTTMASVFDEEGQMLSILCYSSWNKIKKTLLMGGMGSMAKIWVWRGAKELLGPSKNWNMLWSSSCCCKALRLVLFWRCPSLSQIYLIWL